LTWRQPVLVVGPVVRAVPDIGDSRTAERAFSIPVHEVASPQGHGRRKKAIPITEHPTRAVEASDTTPAVPLARPAGRTGNRCRDACGSAEGTGCRPDLSGGWVETADMIRTDNHTLSAVADDDVDEVGEFIATLLVTPATRLTACRGWTAHELVAHLAAGAREEADIIEAHLDGVQRPTRGFEAREQPYRALPDVEVRDRLVEEAGRLTVALDHLRTRQQEPVMFTGRPMSAADFAMHSRSECALHRWDLIGRDDIGWRMLAQPSMTTHALAVLTSMSTLAESPANRLARYAPRDDVRVLLRSSPHDDLVATVTGSTLTLTLQPIDDTAADVELDPAARLLALWGRREPTAHVDVHADGRAAEVLDALFGW
jgi:hypothetical protein